MINKIKIFKAPLSGERRRKYADFIENAGLRDEGDSDVIAWMDDDDGHLAAVGSLAGHTLKQFAVSPKIEGSGVMALIMTKLIDEAYASGISRLFLCTKPSNAEMLSSLGFHELVSTDDAVLMENRRNGIDRFLASVKEDAVKYTDAMGLNISNAIIGAIVCNCDPFTLGHRYLVEYAASRCDFLYIFAVSESGSYFDPRTRLEMIKAGTSDIANSRVYESDQYLVSRATFPAYFIRDEQHADEVRSEIDIKLFAERIAPELGIKRRFVGSEPYSTVTDAYNRRMKELLPEHSIELIEIPRLEAGDPLRPVSASHVRRLLASGDMRALSALVPDTTYEIISRLADERGYADDRN